MELFLLRIAREANHELLGFALIGHRFHRFGHCFRISEILAVQGLRSESNSYTKGIPVGTFIPIISSSETPSKYLIRARREFP